MDGGPFVTRFEAAFGLVLLCVVATYVFASLTAYHGVGGVFITALASITGVIALASANARSRYVALGRLLGVAAIVLAIVGSSADQRWAFGVAALLVTVLLAVGAFAVLGAVITEQKVGFRTILGAVSVYITLGLLFAFVFVAVDRLQSGPFFAGNSPLQAGDYLFFSMTTLTTTGYGNLVPGGQPGKIFATLEMLMGQIFLVTLIARLVTMWQPGQWLRAGGMRGGGVPTTPTDTGAHVGDERGGAERVVP